MKKKACLLIVLVFFCLAALFSCNSMKDVTISFDSQGGSRCKAITVDNSAESIDLPTPTRDHYSFTGWYEDEDLSQIVNDPILAADFPTENVTYYAGWEKIYYTVFFYVGDTRIASKNFDYNGTLKESDYPSLEEYPDYYWDYRTMKITESTDIRALRNNADKPDTPDTAYSVEYISGGRRYAYYSGAKDEEISVPEDPMPTANSYFVGWSLNEGGIKESSLPTRIPAADVVYYALFRAVPDSTDYLIYREIEGTSNLVITGLTAEGLYQQEIGIPSQIGGKKVVAIGYEDAGTKKISELRVFKSPSLTTVYIPSTVTSIGAWSFLDCASLEKVVFLGDSLFYIGHGAFAGCTSLKSFKVTDRVTMAGDFAFAGVTTTKTGTKLPEQVKRALPALWQSENWYVTDMALADFSMGPSSVLSNIGAYGFYRCADLTSLKLSASIASVGYLSFADSGVGSIDFYPDGNLISIDGVVYSSNRKILYYYPTRGNETYEMPSGVETVSESAFRDNDNLVSVSVADSVVAIGVDAFRGCEKLTTVSFGTNSELVSLYEGAFADCHAIETIRLPSKLRNFADRAFENDSALREVTFAGTLVNGIGKYAFYQCVALERISLPEQVKYIGDYAFCDCSSLLVFSLNGEGLTMIGDYAFCDCSELVQVYLPGSLEYIGEYAFYGRSRKMKMDLERTQLDALEFVGERAFANTSIKEFTLRGRLKSAERNNEKYAKNYTLGDYAFADCTSLRSFGFAALSGVYDTVPEGFLYGCTGLTEVSVKQNITTVSNYAFYGCTSLKTVSFEKELDVQMITTIGKYAFAECRSLLSGDDKARLLPVSLVTIGEGAFMNCSSITSITIPKNMEVLSKDAFAGCTELSLVSYDDPTANALHTLEENCFGGCVALGREHAFSLPYSLGLKSDGKGLRKNPFYGCSSLQAFYFPNGNRNGLAVSDGVVYKDDTYKEIYAFPTAKLGETVNISTDVTVIEEYAFYGSTITGLAFDDNDDADGDGEVVLTMVSIGEYAFADSSLVTVTINARVYAIGDHAFENCRLDSLSIANKYYTRSGIIAEDNKVYKTDTTENNSLVIGNYAFYRTTLSSVVLPHRVTEIGEGAFSACYSLSSLDFTNKVDDLTNTLSLGDYVFADNPALRKVELPDRLELLGSYSFKNCYNLENVYFTEGNNGLTIMDYAFFGNHFLYEVTLPANIVSLGKGVFRDNTRLKYVYFPQELTQGATLSIPEEAFLDDGMLDSLTVPSYVTEIGKKAYYGTNLYAIEFEEGLYPLTIGDYAFAEATNLTEIILPDNCVSIGEYAFAGAHKLRDVVYSGYHYGKTAITGYSVADPVGDAEVYEKNFFPATGTYREDETYYTMTRHTGSTGTQITVAVYVEDAAKYVPAVGTFSQEYFYYNAVEYDVSGSIGAPCASGVFVCRYVRSRDVQYAAGKEYYSFSVKELTGGDDEMSYIVRDGALVTAFKLAIGRGAFTSTVLVEAVVDGRVREVGEGAFSDIATLTTAIVDGKISSVPASAFRNDKALLSVYIGSTITGIDSYAFAESGITVLLGVGASLPLENIGDHAFYNTPIVRMSISTGSATMIGESAFERCSDLVSVTIETTKELTLGRFVFGNCQALSALTLSAKTLSLGVGFAYNAVSLSSGFSVSETTPAYEMIDGVLYTTVAGGKEVVFYPAGKAGSFLELAYEVRSFSDYAFYGNRYLTGILIRYNGGTVLTRRTDSFSETGDIVFYVASNLVSLYKNEWSISAVQAYSANLGGFVLAVQNTGKYFVTSYLGDEQNLTIRGSMSGGNVVYEVTGIAKDAFRNNTTLKSVVIGSGIKTVSNSAFRGCTSLESVQIGENVTAVKNYAFYGCINLKEVVYQGDSSVVSIGNYAFSGCSSIVNMTLPRKLESIGSYAFANNSSLKQIDFPEGLTEIKSNAFENCDSLRSVVLPSSLTHIEKYLFRNCEKLIYIRCLAEEVPTIDDNTFYGIPDGIFFFVPGKSLGRYNVDSRWRSHIDKLISADYIYDEEGATEFYGYVLEPIEEGSYRLVAYIGDEEVVKIRSGIASGVSVTAIGENAFSTFVKEVEIGIGVTAIDANAFTYAVNLERIELPSSVKSIGSYAFADLKKLTEVKINNQTYVSADREAKAYSDEGKWLDHYSEFYVLTDGEYELATTVYSSKSEYYHAGIGNYLTTIADHAFYNCTAISSFTFPHSVTSIGKYAFSCGTGEQMILENITFEHDYTVQSSDTVRLEEYCFANNVLLSSVEFNCYLAYLGEGAFSNCLTLTSLRLNYSTVKASDYLVTEIPKNAQRIFENCDKLNVIVPTEDNLNRYKSVWSSEDVNVRSSILNKFVAESPFIIGDFVYAYVNKNQKKLAIIGYLGTGTEVSFTEDVTSVTMNGAIFTVTRIGREETLIEGEVSGNVISNNVTSVIIGGNVSVIGADSFRNCLNLQKVEVRDNGLEKIESYAFAGCPNLTDVTLPVSLKTIEEYAFSGCTRLNGYDEDAKTGFHVVEDERYASTSGLTFGTGVFADCEGMTFFIMPSHLKEIGDRTFYNCTNLTSVKYGKDFYLTTGEVLGEPDVKLARIGTYAFYRTAITEISLPETVERVYGYAFAECQHLLAVYLYREAGGGHAEETRTERTVFDGVKTNNIKIYVPGTSLNSYKNREGWNLKQVVTRRFYGDFAYEIESGSATLTAYRGTETELYIPDSFVVNGSTYFVTAIAAYFGTPNLERVVFSNTSHVYKIESRAFAGCTALREIRLPASDEKSTLYLEGTEVEIGENAFDDCSSLIDVHLPLNMTYLPAYLFHNCVSLEEITLPSTIGNVIGKDDVINLYGGIIGNAVFYNCVSLSRMRVLFSYPSSATSLTVYGSDVFYMAGSAVHGGLRIVVPAEHVATFKNNWPVRNWDYFSFIADTLLFGDFLMQTAEDGYELLQYRGDADIVDLDGDFAGKHIVTINDILFTQEATVSHEDFLFRSNTDGDGSWTLLSYSGTEDLNIGEITVLGRKITRIDSEVTLDSDVTLTVNGEVQYDASLAEKIKITEE